MTRVRQILDGKEHPLLSIGPEATVYEALSRMALHDIGALVVLEEGRLVGIFSERDYARKVILVGKASKLTHVREIMTADVPCVGPEDGVDHCMSLMTEKRARHLAVLDGLKVVGVVSIGDVVKSVIQEQEQAIRQLQSYING